MANEAADVCYSHFIVTFATTFKDFFSFNSKGA